MSHQRQRLVWLCCTALGLGITSGLFSPSAQANSPVICFEYETVHYRLSSVLQEDGTATSDETSAQWSDDATLSAEYAPIVEFSSTTINFEMEASS